MQYGRVMLAKLLSKLSVADKIQETDSSPADQVLEYIMYILENFNGDPSVPEMCLFEISNIATHLSSKAVLIAVLPRIEKFRSYAEIVLNKIEDFCADRSLEGLEQRVDELVSRINRLNNEV